MALPNTPRDGVRPKGLAAPQQAPEQEGIRFQKLGEAGLAERFAPEIEAEQRNDVMAERQRIQNERNQEALAKHEKAVQNTERERKLRQEGRPFFTTALGDIEPSDTDQAWTAKQSEEATKKAKQGVKDQATETVAKINVQREAAGGMLTATELKATRKEAEDLRRRAKNEALTHTLETLKKHPLATQGQGWFSSPTDEARAFQERIAKLEGGEEDLTPEEIQAFRQTRPDNDPFAPVDEKDSLILGEENKRKRLGNLDLEEKRAKAIAAGTDPAEVDKIIENERLAADPDGALKLATTQRDNIGKELEKMAEQERTGIPGGQVGQFQRKKQALMEQQSQAEARRAEAENAASVARQTTAATTAAKGADVGMTADPKLETMNDATGSILTKDGVVLAHRDGKALLANPGAPLSEIVAKAGDVPVYNAPDLGGGSPAAVRAALAKNIPGAEAKFDAKMQSAEADRQAATEGFNRAMVDMRAQRAGTVSSMGVKFAQIKSQVDAGNMAPEAGNIALRQHADELADSAEEQSIGNERVLATALQDFQKGVLSAQQLNQLFATAGASKTGVETFKEHEAAIAKEVAVTDSLAEEAAKSDPMLQWANRSPVAKKLNEAAMGNIGLDLASQKPDLSGDAAERGDELLLASQRMGAATTTAGGALPDQKADLSKVVLDARNQVETAVAPALAVYNRKLDEKLAAEGYTGEEAARLKTQIRLDALEKSKIGIAEQVAGKGGAAGFVATKLPFAGGFVAAAQLMPAVEITERLRNGEEVSDAELAILDETIQYMNRPRTMGANVFEGITELPAFVVELATTAGVATGAKTVARKGLEAALRTFVTAEGRAVAAKLVAKGMAEKEAKGVAASIGARSILRQNLLGRTATGLAGEVARLPVASAGRIELGFEKRMLEGVQTETGPDGKIAAQLPALAPDVGKALQNATVDSLIENASERFGSFLGMAGIAKQLRVSKGWEAAKNLAFVRAFKKLNPRLSTSGTAKFLRRADIGGFAEEWSEERAGELGRAMFMDEEGHELKMPSAEDMATELIVLAVPGSANAIAKYRAETGQRRRREVLANQHLNDRIQLADPDAAAQMLTAHSGQAVSAEDVKAATDLVGPVDMGDTLRDIENEQIMLDEQSAEAEAAGENRRASRYKATAVQMEQAKTESAIIDLAHGVAASREITEARKQAADMQAQATDEVSATAAVVAQTNADRASALVKVARGRGDVLTTQEQAALLPMEGETVPMMVEEGGNQIITDAGRNWLKSTFPVSGSYVRQSETEYRSKLGNASNQAAAASNAPGNATTSPNQAQNASNAAPAASGTWSVQGTGGTLVSIPASEATTPQQAMEKLVAKLPATEAANASTLIAPKASETVPYSGQKAGQTANPAKPESSRDARVFREKAKQTIQARALKGGAASTAEDVADILAEAYDRTAPLFPGGMRFTKATEGSGFYYNAQDNTIEVDLARAGQQLQGFIPAARKAYVQAATRHEIIHKFAVDEFGAVHVDRFSQFWRELGQSKEGQALQRDVVTRAYFNAKEAKGEALPEPADMTDAQASMMVHELLRMTVEDAAFGGKITEALAVSPTLKAQLADFLRRLSEWLRNAISRLPKTQRKELTEMRDKVIARMKAMGVELETEPAPEAAAPIAPAKAQITRAAAPAVSAPSTFAPVYGNSGTLYTTSNEPIEFKWAVVEADQAQTSHDLQGKPNPSYDQALQNRLSRDQGVLDQTVQDIRRNTNYARLADADTAGGGSPVLNEQGQVEAGNGRMLGIRSAYADGLPNAQAYRSALLADADRLGLDRTALGQMRQPVLVRVRTSPVDAPAFAADANAPTTAQLTALETAVQDASRLTPETLADLTVTADGDIYTKDNEEFFRRFFGTTVTTGQAGNLLTPEGTLNQEGLRRMRNAILVAAYGSDEAGLAAFDRLAERIDDESKNVSRALMAAAPGFARVRGLIATGARADASIATDVAVAAAKYGQLKQEGSTVAAYFQQGQLIPDTLTPVQRRILTLFEARRNSAKGIADVLRGYNAALENSEDPRQQSLIPGEPFDKEKALASAITSTATGKLAAADIAQGDFLGNLFDIDLFGQKVDTEGSDTDRRNRNQAPRRTQPRRGGATRVEAPDAGSTPQDLFAGGGNVDGGSGRGRAGLPDSPAPGEGSGDLGQTERPREEDAQGGPSDAGRPDADSERSAVGDRPPVGSPGRNYEAPAGVDQLAPTTNNQRMQANIEALEVLRRVQSESRNATKEEKDVLARFSGWGWNKEMFGDNPRYAKEHAALKRLLSEDEFESARQVSLFSHYTAAPVIRSMWEIAERLGFKGGKVLEPAGGIGHFFGMMPGTLADKSSLTGVEIDTVSGEIFKALYPESDIRVQGFETARIANNSQDVVIANVPFDQTAPYDPAYADGPKLNLHNWMLAKSLDKVKPGGLVVAISTSHTMQSHADHRQLLAGKGDLVGAIRLPNDAFQANAGTAVTTDILIFRKPDSLAGVFSEPWALLSSVGEQAVTEEGNTRVEPIMVNEYYAANPKMALGRHSLEGGMYRADEYALVSEPGQDTQALMDSAIAALPTDIMGSAWAEGEKASVAADMGEKEDSYVERDGEIYQVQGGQLEKADLRTEREASETDDKNRPVEPKTLTQSEEARRKKVSQDYIKIRESIKEQIRLELDANATDEQIEAHRRHLNSAYDNFKGRWGTLNRPMMHNSPVRFLEDDPEFPLVTSLEDERTIANPKRPGRTMKEYVRADIFRRRVNVPAYEPTSADSTSDAVVISMGHRGRIDVPLIAKLRDMTEEETRAALLNEPSVFLDPQTGRFEMAEMYLTGQVRRKLKQAQAAALDEPAYQRNVTALEAAQPPWAITSEISMPMGSRWMPGSVYEAFVKSLFQATTARVEYIPAGNTYSVGMSVPVAVSTEWTLHNEGPSDLLRHALNGTSPRITKTVGYGVNKTTTTDLEATSAVQAKVDEIKDKWKQWSLETFDHHPAIEQAYNEKVNHSVELSFDGTYLTLPGLSTEVYRLPHRMRGIARVLQLGGGMLAHAVGSGKTFTMIAAAKEMKRMGHANKPLIVVQKATIGQFAASYRRAYPTAKVLVANEKNFTAKRRQKFFSRIATGDWDAVIMTHPNFDLLPSDPKTETDYFNARLSELGDIKAAAKSAGDKVKESQVIKAQRNLRAKLEKAQAKLDARQDNVLYFQQLGIDMLMIDEAHAYKRVPLVTNRSNLKGIPNGSSQRAMALEMVTEGIHKRTGGRNVVLATGTPVTNTMAEAYVMLKLGSPNVLADYGIQNFDDFASMFGELSEKVELTWSGKHKVINRFNKFVNGRELTKMIRGGFDVAMGNEDLGLKVPRLKGGKPQIIITESTSGQEQFSQWVERISAEWDASTPKERKEKSYIPILTMGAGMASALDPRLVDPNAADDPGSKVNRAVKEISRIFHESTDRKGAQLVFADRFKPMSKWRLEQFAPSGMGYDRHAQDLEVEETADDAETEDDSAMSRAEDKAFSSGGFNLYHDLRDKLIAGGIPADQVAIIHDYNTDKKRADLFDAVNAGEIRILIGSTEKLGVGVNAQERLAAMHHLDPPRSMTPAMVEQRDGRGIRQGNLHYKWWKEAYDRASIAALAEGKSAEEADEAGLKAGEPFELQNIRYATKGSMDAGIIALLESKQRFITQVLKGFNTDREFEDPADEAMLSFAEMKALATGDYRVILQVKLTEDVRRLKVERDGFLRRKSDAARAMRDYNNAVMGLERDIPVTERAHELYLSTFGDGVYSITVDGKTITGAKDTAEWLKQTQDEHFGQVLTIATRPMVTRFEYNGFRMVLTTDRKLGGKNAEDPEDTGMETGLEIIHPTHFDVTLERKRIGKGRTAAAVITQMGKNLQGREFEQRASLGTYRQKIDGYKAIMESTWSKGDDLDRAEKDLFELNRSLVAGATPAEQKLGAAAIAIADNEDSQRLERAQAYVDGKLSTGERVSQIKADLKAASPSARKAAIELARGFTGNIGVSYATGARYLMAADVAANEDYAKSDIYPEFVRRQADFAAIKPDYDEALRRAAGKLAIAFPITAPLKGPARAIEKLEQKRNELRELGYPEERYDPAKLAETLADILRGSLLVDSIDQVPEAIQVVRESFGPERVRIKDDRFANPTPAGYSDVQIDVEMAPGYVAELQIHIPEMLVAKEGNGVKQMGIPEQYHPENLNIPGLDPDHPGHKYYEEQRKLPKGTPRRKELDAIQSRLYGGAGQVHHRRTRATKAASSNSLTSAPSGNGAEASGRGTLPLGPTPNTAPSGSTTLGTPESSKNRAPGANIRGSFTTDSATKYDTAQGQTVDSAANEAATGRNDKDEPTMAQKEAGNYPKGHTRMSGVPLTFENPAGSHRRPEWPMLKAHYGYIKGTKDGTEEQLDVFVRPGTLLDYTGPVFIVNQMHTQGERRFDEHKIMIGWPSQAEALKAYLSNYTPGWRGAGSVVPFTWDQFKGWLDTGDHKARAVSPAAAAGYTKKLYHGTGAKFTEFNRSVDFGIHLGNKATAAQRMRDLREDKSDNPEEYANVPGDWNVMPLMVKLTNPLRWADVHFDLPEEFGDESMVRAELAEQGHKPALTSDQMKQISAMKDMAEVRKFLQSLGYDGVVYRNTIEGSGTDSYIVFDPSQVKSPEAASFDSRSNNILRAADIGQDAEYEAAMSYLRDDLPSQDTLRGVNIAQGGAYYTVPGDRTMSAKEAEEMAGIMNEATRSHWDKTRVAETHRGWDAEAERMIDTDEAGTLRTIVRDIATGEGLGSPVKIKAATMLMPKLLTRGLLSGDPQQIEDAQALAFGFNKTKSETARALAAMWSPHKTPEERHRELLTRLIFNPTPAEQARIERAITRATKDAKIASLRRQLAAAKGELVTTRTRAATAEVRALRDRMADKTKSEAELAALRAELAAAEQLLSEGADLQVQRSNEAKAQAARILDLENELAKAKAEKDQLQLNNEIMRERLDRIEEELGKLGVTFSDLFITREAVVRLRGSALVKTALEKMTVRDRAVIRGIMEGQPDKTLAKTYNLRVPQVQAIEKRFDALMTPILEKWVERGFTLADFELMDTAGNRLDLDSIMNADGTLKAAAVASVSLSAEEKAKRVKDIMNALKPTAKARKTGVAFRQTGTGVNTSPYGFNMANTAHVKQVARAIQATDNNVMDMAYEFWVNGLLSGPKTHVANILGNGVNAAWDLTIQRGMEAFLNIFVGDAAGATFGEMRYMAKAAKAAWLNAASAASTAWSTENGIFEDQWLNRPVTVSPNTLVGGTRQAIPGAFGRTVRIPGRLLVTQDEFAKTFVGHIEVAAQAYRIAKSEGLSGAALETRISILTRTPGSAAWLLAVDKAKQLTFQQDLPKFVQKLEDLKNYKSANAAEALAKFVLRLILPFIKTPYNIFKTGIRKTPVGTLNMALKAGMSLWQLRDGKAFVEGYPKAALIRDAAEQVFAWTATAALWMIGEGDPDDDEKRILLTGTRPQLAEPGARQWLERNRGGQTMLLIDGKPVLNWGRIEPFATAFASIIDALREIKTIPNGRTRTEAAQRIIAAMAQQTEDKTFLSGISSVFKAMDMLRSGEAAGKVAKTITTGIVPNIIRQPLRSMDEYVRDTKTAPWYYHAFPIGALAEPMHDIYGRPMKKNGNPVQRLFLETGVEVQPRTRLDTALMNWNRDNPLEPFFPTNPTMRTEGGLFAWKDLSGKWHRADALQASQLRQARGRVYRELADDLVGPSDTRRPGPELIEDSRRLGYKASVAVKKELDGRAPSRGVVRPKSLAEMFGVK